MLIDLGLIDYEESCGIQKELVRRRQLGEIEDSVVLAEHYPVFTIGRTGSEANLLVDERALAGPRIKVLWTDRGGDITFHGPGQLLVYPILDLRQRGKDLHLYMRYLEAVIIKFLEGYSIQAERSAGKTGVWVGGKKIASIGIAARNWITFHGLSLNVNVDLKFFSMINPCGLKGLKATSMEAALGRKISMGEVKNGFMLNFNSVFNNHVTAGTQNG